MVSNLGSLLVRIVLQPFEESAFQTFSRATSVESKAASSPQISIVQTRTAVLATLVKLATMGGLVIAAYGQCYSYFLIRFLYGKRWSDETDAAAVLRIYCVYVFILAVNGITEAYVHSVSSAKELRKANKWLLVFSVCNLASGVVLQQLAGARGLVLANCVNMILRIIYSFTHIRRDMREFPEVWDILPRVSVLATLAATASMCAVTNRIFQRLANTHFAYAAVAHVLAGIVSVLLFGASVWKLERHFCQQLSALRRGVALPPSSVEKRD
jgi:oligosaccharide translocation protein RFT1